MAFSAAAREAKEPASLSVCSIIEAMLFDEPRAGEPSTSGWRKGGGGFISLAVAEVALGMTPLLTFQTSAFHLFIHYSLFLFGDAYFPLALSSNSEFRIEGLHQEAVLPGWCLPMPSSGQHLQESIIVVALSHILQTNLRQYTLASRVERMFIIYRTTKTSSGKMVPEYRSTKRSPWNW